MKFIKMSQHPNNIIFVKVGIKYSHKHVNALFDKLILHYPQAEFWCYTDNCDGINVDVNIIDPIITLKKWWAKLALFSNRMPYDGTCLFFDLDTVINGPIDNFIVDYDDITVINAYWKKDLNFEPHDYDVKINSSIITWTAGTQDYIWKRFLVNRDYFMRKYAGIDRFIHYENIKYKTFRDGIANTMIINNMDAPVNLYNGMVYEIE